VKPLAGSDLHRLRIGSYRALMTIDAEAGRILVKLIRSRGDVYKR
jgi:mRNA-degrading endonuclease RelE of RelBE toxin-antitoxin system